MQHQSNEDKIVRMWALHKHPSDFPDKYVARLFENETPTATVIAVSNYDDLAIQMMNMGLVRLDRSHDDPETLLEVWL